MTPGKIWGLRRLADASGRFKMVAVDQRPPIKNLCAERRGEDEARYEDVCAVKAAIVDELGDGASALLLDPHYAYPAAVGLMSPQQGLLVTLEDSIFTETPDGRLSSPIDDWSVAKIKGIGADAVKVLAWYRPDASEPVNAHQQEFVAAIGAACATYDIPFVFELLLYPLGGDVGYAEDPAKRADHVIDSVATFADPLFGVDLFKLESPLPAAEVPPFGDAATQVLFNDLGAAAGRPWVMLSAGATAADFRRVLEYAYAAGASGYLAGRAIWWDAFQAFPDLGAMREGLRSEGRTYMSDINALTDDAALPWPQHPALLGTTTIDDGAGFRSAYRGIP